MRRAVGFVLLLAAGFCLVVPARFRRVGGLVGEGEGGLGAGGHPLCLGGARLRPEEGRLLRGGGSGGCLALGGRVHGGCGRCWAGEAAAAASAAAEAGCGAASSGKGASTGG